MVPEVHLFRIYYFRETCAVLNTSVCNVTYTKNMYALNKMEKGNL